MQYDEMAVREAYRKLTQLFIEKKWTVSTMESATGGQIASLITDTPGASKVLKGAFVTYCDEAKIMQGVPAETIAEHTVYSKETAAAMARACQKAYDSSIGIGVTGQLPGRVFYAIAWGVEMRTAYVDIEAQESRLLEKMGVASAVAEAVMQFA